MKLTIALLSPTLILWAPTTQAQVPTPLHRFFQQNFDSTIVYQSGSSRNNSPHYLILAKYQNRLAFFTYTSPYRNIPGHYFPGKLSQKFANEERRFRATIPDTNQYLLPRRIAGEILSRNWRLLNPPQLWTIQGDQQAPKSKSKCAIDDGDENTFYLLSKTTIQVAHFYAPEYYEQCAGKDVNREQAIRARNTLHALLAEAR
ncbi:hypothetical protein HNQ93_000615 [Hymenobacter luteus]|uniref:GLPGLI family protein n=2 Tax=Hymenobacter TaxID=89966 RepID=A0A7W9WAX2_9BACT|nr:MULTISPECIES: hypothetical protein [Hymenobacter]MBB4599905.1 hypothetical protein [Hymenobacter latericoloratus]MBB6057785.1 hypothetical protein [Hymenobacter luteus]